MSIFTSKNVWNFLDKNSADKIWSKKDNEKYLPSCQNGLKVLIWGYARNHVGAVYHLRGRRLKLQSQNGFKCFLKSHINLHRFSIWGGFICTFSLLISLSITLQTSKFRNQFTISSKYFDMACYLKREAYSGSISFEVQWNDIWTYYFKIFWTDCELIPELTISQYDWKGIQKGKGTDETLQCRGHNIAPPC